MKLVRALLIYLLVSLLVGLVLGTWLRLRLERAPVYIGSATPLDAARAG